MAGKFCAVPGYKATISLGIMSRVGYCMALNDSDSAYCFRFLMINDYDSLKGGVKTGHMLISQGKNILVF